MITVAVRKSSFRRALELEQLAGNELALCALLDAGLKPAEAARVRVTDFRVADDDRGFVRIVSPGSVEGSVRRVRYAPLDDLQRITLERYTDSRRRGASGAFRLEPMVLNARGGAWTKSAIAEWLRRRGFAIERAS